MTPRSGNSEAGRTPGRRRVPRRALAVVLSVAAHLALIPVVLTAARQSPVPLPEFAPPPVIVELVQPPPPPPPAPSEPPPGPKADPAPPSPEAAAPEPPRPAPVRPPPRPRPARLTPPAPVEPLPAAASPPAPPAPPVFATVGEGELAGATVAGRGSGSGGGAGAGGGGGGGGGGSGGCDLVRDLQEALRADADVRTAVSQAHRATGSGRALLVWDGDWTRNPGQAGKGLAGVRQAIALEVAFAPQACRQQAMRGLVLITFSDTPGGPRIVLGRGSWRWTDLLRG